MSTPSSTAGFRFPGDTALRRLTGFLLLLAGACAGAAVVLLARPSGPDRVPLLPTAAASGSTAPGAGAAAPGGPGASSDAVPAASLTAGDGYAAIAKSVMPAVVNISSMQVVQTYER
jgi:hypothetical protein